MLDQFDGPTQARLVIGLLVRHITGDWGEVDSDDKAANDHSVILGERLLSAYRLPDGTKVWVILVTVTYSILPYGRIEGVLLGAVLEGPALAQSGLPGPPLVGGGYQCLATWVGGEVRSAGR